MSTIPTFTIRPALQLPRPDRIAWKSLWGYPRSLTSEQALPLASLVERYGLSLTHSVREMGDAGRSHNWLLETGSGKKVLKSYKEAVDREQIIQEHSILAQLADRRFPAPRLVAARGGETWVEEQGAHYALFDYLEGYYQFHKQLFVPNQTRAFLRTAGAALASLHQTLRDFEPTGKNPNGFISVEGPRWRGLEWFLGKLKTSQETNRRQRDNCSDDVHGELVNRSPWIEERLAQLEESLQHAPLTRVIIHGDYGPYNLLLKPGSPVVILDFELARVDWRLTDLAFSMMTFARNRLGFQLEKFRVFLQGYQETGAIPPEELRYLPLVCEYLSLRRAIVCWFRSLGTEQEKWLSEAIDRLSIVDWIREHQAAVVEVCMS
ncbi:MAG TPA: phosphotransferase [Anaerolineaceae bacterium]|nr:phosphotransferase [Anaerolineaceae bacterium]